jgi:hypothetical protein
MSWPSSASSTPMSWSSSHPPGLNPLQIYALVSRPET